MTGVSVERIVEVYPCLYHMAHIDSWPSIKEHGLLSTSALLDLLDVDSELRIQLIRKHRPDSVTLDHDTYGSVVIRDQKPMSDAGLLKSLQDGITPTQWYERLNQNVFFWPTQDRLHRMLRARAYKNDRHLVIVVDTASLLARHFDNVLLSRMNSGCTVPVPHERGENTFLPPAQFPFEERKKSRGEGFAELVIRYAVPDLREHVIEVYVANQTDRLADVWSR